MTTATILLVDDNPVNLVVLRALLGKEGYELIAADSGQAAIDLVRGNPRFDLILLDVSMPDLDGFTVCRLLKDDPTTAHIPIVFVSGVRTDPESVSKGYAAGGAGYLTKPIEDAQVRAWVKATLQVSRPFRELAEQQGSSPANVQELREAVAALPGVVKGHLEFIYANADALAVELPEDSPFRQRLEEVKTRVERVVDAIKHVSRKV